MNKKTKQKIMRVVAMYLALNLLAEFIIPIPALALTGGPSQPEVESFEPVSTTEMVNLFTGDFNYNIPLLTVPGPNGGYPINLAYHAGIGMEQEASWCGLGWNINPGVINRNMRGLPDDFDGDDVTKTMYYKPQETWTLGYKQVTISPTGILQSILYNANNVQQKMDREYFGLSDGKVGPSFSAFIHYNNYRGVGLGVNLSLTAAKGDVSGSHFSIPLSLSYDSDGGLGVSPSVAYTKVSSDKERKYTGVLSFDYNSRNGKLSLVIKSNLEKFNDYKENFVDVVELTEANPFSAGKEMNLRSKTGEYIYTSAIRGCFESRPGPGIAFVSQSAIPGLTSPTKGVSVDFGIAIGDPDSMSLKFTKYTKRTFNLAYNRVESKKIQTRYDGYGYLNLQHNSNEELGLWDFNREKDAPVTKNASNIQPAYGTSDILFATGQGVAGAFKPFRSDIGAFYDPATHMKLPGARMLVEFGAKISTSNPEYEVGGDIGVNYAHSYSGDWSGGTTAIGNVQFFGYSSPLYEPAYYAATGEMLAAPLNELDPIGGEHAVRFDLTSILESDIGILSKVEDNLVGDQFDPASDNINGNNTRSTRQKRSQHLSYRTSGQIDKTIGYGSPVVSLYDVNEFPSAGVPANVDYGNYPAHHLGEVTVTNPDGTRYVYGLPVYNTSQKEVMFTKDGFIENNFDKTETYSAGQDNDIGNSEGQDHLFMSTEIPDYTYAYLVTAIYSADYVDLTGDGPSDDDFGYWVKFNYSENVDGEYGWRVPYRDANYSKGHISDLNDDKLSYMYGTKKVYYLNSIETKTHEAHFILNDNSVAAELRADGNGVPFEDFLGSSTMGTGEQLHYLRSIELVSKADPTTILKEVHFEYDFSLCGGVVNNSGTSVTVNSININADTGKLTLKKVWFTHLGNEKGSLSPYIFSYDVGGTYDNPDYDLDHMDRWGNYMPDRTWGNYLLNSNENPYVNQSAYSNNTNGYASAWNLKKITLPSGGEINVTYESDDYAFVQDQPAMQMQRIVGTGEYTDVDANGGATANGSSLSDRNLILFFDLEETFNGTSLTATQKRAKIEPYVRGIEDLYFKAFLKLKKNPDMTGNYSYDYVEGYAEVDQSETYAYGYGPADGSGIITTGWVRVKAVERNPWNPIGQTDHPIKLAGWQYMRLERPDLFDDGNLFQQGSNPTSIGQVVQGFVNIFNDVQRLFGYFNFCQSRGYCNEINLSADAGVQNFTPRPSWLRLNSPDGKKYGGGHRVQKITITDNWDDMSDDTNPLTASYGTEYEYDMPDGTSSGVAEYEPLIGGEENALRKPLRYAERKFPYRNDGLYAEEPFGEGLYPAPNVGYRRVIVKSINNDNQQSHNVSINRAGITVTEFYTAKDFPVINDFTDLQKKNFGIPIIVPFIGEISYNNKGYSQGFCLELNNMHGQIKSQAVYPYDADLDNANTVATSKAEYIYQTVDPYKPDGGNRLSNTVDVLTADGIYEQADIGKTHEFYIDRQQHSNFSVSAGIQTNAGAVPPYIFWGNVFPYFEISASMYRSISTMKIIQRNGVLSEVHEYKDGAKSVNKTLMYDAETGQPLLTQTINNHNRPVYTYNYASHWAYDGMGPAYKNAGAFFDNISVSSGSFTYTNASNYFVVGDEVELEDASLNRTIYWVSSVSGSTVTLIKEDGASTITATGDLRIIRSGRRNQQISTNGTIVSLSNPVLDRYFPLFDAFNAYNATGISDPATLNDFYTDCVTGELRDVTLGWNETNGSLIFTHTGGGCETTVTFPSGHGIDSLEEAFDFDLVYHSNGTVTATNGSTVLTCTWSSPDGCFAACLDDVLHAEAYRFKDTWDFNYLDFGDPKYKLYGGSNTTMASGFNNDFRFGTAGIWRMEESWLYQVDRKQYTASASLTRTPGDGTYKHFVLHDWSTSSNHAAQNPQWSLTNTVTMYDPHGYEVENKNALGIYSAALYDTTSSVPVAVCSNTMHRELAFEGFEDYTVPAQYVASAPHGHIAFASANVGVPILLTTDAAHTGKYSLKVMSNGSAEMNFPIGATNTDMFNPLPDKLYHLSVWVKCSPGSTPSVIVENVDELTTLATGTVDMTANAIDGWRQINLDFTTDDNLDDLRITLDVSHASTGYCYFDDLRIQPFTSGMKTYVYNPLTLWLIAELDDRNYATFYNYDEEGGLVQVKKETENGIVTVKTSRSNIKR